MAYQMMKGKKGNNDGFPSIPGMIASHYDNKSEYDKIAFKNLAIYPTVLSKDDCIKAYNYLQTLKAK